jgi:hypothetical protein
MICEWLIGNNVASCEARHLLGMFLGGRKKTMKSSISIISLRAEIWTREQSVTQWTVTVGLWRRIHSKGAVFVRLSARNILSSKQSHGVWSGWCMHQRYWKSDTVLVGKGLRKRLVGRPVRRWDSQKYGAMTWAVLIWFRVGFYGMIINSCGSLKSGILLDLMNDNKVIKKDCYQIPSLHLLDWFIQNLLFSGRFGWLRIVTR